MLSLSYGISSPLQDRLHQIEQLRRQIILTPLSPITENRLRWETKVNRLYWALTFSNSPLTRAQLVKLIVREKEKPQTEVEKEVVAYQKTLDHISQNWLVSPIPITLRTIAEIADISFKTQLKNSSPNLKQVLDYLQSSPENPVIQAGVAQVHFLDLRPFTNYNEPFARLIPYLFLYKNGYDCRGFLVLEEYWRRDMTGFEQAIRSVQRTKNLTPWLEYFASGMLSQLEKAAAHIASPATQSLMPTSFWKLSDRQKGILALLEEPDSRISNKKVQQLFHVSQITASRDLAKLTNLGLLFPHGKGRSVYYTKV